MEFEVFPWYGIWKGFSWCCYCSPCTEALPAHLHVGLVLVHAWGDHECGILWIPMQFSHGLGTYPADVHPCGGGWCQFQCHQSPEGDLHFHPVDDWVVVGQPVISEYHQVFFIQLGYIELDNMRLTSSKFDGDSYFFLNSGC